MPVDYLAFRKMYVGRVPGKRDKMMKKGQASIVVRVRRSTHTYSMKQQQQKYMSRTLFFVHACNLVLYEEEEEEKAIHPHIRIVYN